MRISTQRQAQPAAVQEEDTHSVPLCTSLGRGLSCSGPVAVSGRPPALVRANLACQCFRIPVTVTLSKPS